MLNQCGRAGVRPHNRMPALQGLPAGLIVAKGGGGLVEIWQAFINVLGEITRGQVLSGLIGALIATALAHFLRVNREERTTRKIRDRHFAALAAEIDYCAQLAGTYVDEPYAAPLYRFPTTVYATVYAKLVSETLSGEDDCTDRVLFSGRADEPRSRRNRAVSCRWRSSKHAKRVRAPARQGASYAPPGESVAKAISRFPAVRERHHCCETAQRQGTSAVAWRQSEVSNGASCAL